MECANLNCESYCSDEANNCTDTDDVTECPDYIPPSGMTHFDYMTKEARVKEWEKYHEGLTSKGCITPEDRVRKYDKSVKHPPHYTAYPLEVIEIIKLILDEIDRRGIKLTSFEAACLKDEIKYRFRAGLKGDAAEDIAKAMQYKEFREKK